MLIKIKKYTRKIVEHYKEKGFIKTCSWLYSCIKFKIATRKTSFSFDYDNLVEKNKTNNKFLLKQSKNVFIFATVPYYDIGGGQRSAQLANIFNKMGFKVFYIYAFPSSESQKFYLENPSVLHMHIDSLKKDYLKKYMQENDIVIFEAPCASFDEYLKMAKNAKAKVIYESIDNWEDKELGGLVFSKETLERLIKSADLINCTAKQLVTQMEKYIKKYKVDTLIKYSPNAVNDELFDYHKQYTQPEDLVIGKKTLLYYGSLWGSWFNWDLIFEVAKKNPEITINLIGDYSGILDTYKKSPSNVHFLGLKKQEELPAYLYYSDFAILPFYNDNIGKYVSPLKIFEYLAMNKCVISCSLDDIKGYPSVKLADTESEWTEIINSNQTSNESEIIEFIQKNNWYDRVTSMLDLLYPKTEGKCLKKYYDNISVVVLNYNNMNVIFRCVDTLLKYNKRYQYEVIVVDNQSKDGSYEKLLEQYKSNENVKILRNVKNGCSSGRNLGAKNSKNDFILFLDSDQWILHKYWLDNYLELMERMNNDIVIGWGAGWFNKKGFAYHVVDSFAHRYLPPQYIATNDIGYLATCGFLIPKKFFEKIGGFDEHYDPTCYEDTDLSLAVRNLGKEIYFSKYLGVGHLPHQTTKSGSEAHTKLINEKGKYFINKWRKINKKLLNYIK